MAFLNTWHSNYLPTVETKEVDPYKDIVNNLGEGLLSYFRSKMLKRLKGKNIMDVITSPAFGMQSADTQKALAGLLSKAYPEVKDYGGQTFIYNPLTNETSSLYQRPYKQEDIWKNGQKYTRNYYANGTYKDVPAGEMTPKEKATTMNAQAYKKSVETDRARAFLKTANILLRGYGVKNTVTRKDIENDTKLTQTYTMLPPQAKEAYAEAINSARKNLGLPPIDFNAQEQQKKKQRQQQQQNQQQQQRAQQQQGQGQGQQKTPQPSANSQPKVNAKANTGTQKSNRENYYRKKNKEFLSSYQLWDVIAP